MAQDLGIAHEPGHEVPVVSEVDVAVVGGGTAGVMAAIGAAREGARTCLIERFGSVGGMVGMGLMGHFGNCFRTADGRDIVSGPPRDLLARLAASGAMPYADIEEALRTGLHIFYRHEHAGQECLRMLLEANVELWLHSFFGRAVPSESGYNLFFECKGGRRAIRARQVIDCTGEADVAMSLGAKMQEEKTLRFSWGLLFEMGHVDLIRYGKFLEDCPASCPEWDAWLAGYLDIRLSDLCEAPYWSEWMDGGPRAWPFRRQIMQAVAAGDLDLVRKLPEGGMVRYGWDGFWPEPWHGLDTVTANVCMVTGLNPSDPRHVTLAEVSARTYAFDFLRFLRKYLPGFEHAVVRTMGAQTVPRGGREIVGEATGGPARPAAPQNRADIVCVVGGGGTGLPLGMFAPKGIPNLLVAGRCADGGYSVRASVSCMAAGFSCGIVAALAAAHGKTPTALDPSERRAALVRQGVLLEPSSPVPGFQPLTFQRLPGVPSHDATEGAARARKLS